MNIGGECCLENKEIDRLIKENKKAEKIKEKAAKDALKQVKKIERENKNQEKQTKKLSKYGFRR